MLHIFILSRQFSAVFSPSVRNAWHWSEQNRIYSLQQVKHYITSHLLIVSVTLRLSCLRRCITRTEAGAHTQLDYGKWLKSTWQSNITWPYIWSCEGHKVNHTTWPGWLFSKGHSIYISLVCLWFIWITTGYHIFKNIHSDNSNLHFLHTTHNYIMALVIQHATATLATATHFSWSDVTIVRMMKYLPKLLQITVRKIKSVLWCDEAIGKVWLDEGTKTTWLGLSHHIYTHRLIHIDINLTN